MKVRPINGDSLTDKKPLGLCINLPILARRYKYNVIIRFFTKCHQNQRIVAFHTSETHIYTYNETSALKANKSIFTYIHGLQVAYMFSFLIYDYVSDITRVGHSMNCNCRSGKLSVKKSKCSFPGA